MLGRSPGRGVPSSRCDDLDLLVQVNSWAGCHTAIRGHLVQQFVDTLDAATCGHLRLRHRDAPHPAHVRMYVRQAAAAPHVMHVGVLYILYTTRILFLQILRLTRIGVTDRPTDGLALRHGIAAEPGTYIHTYTTQGG